MFKKSLITLIFIAWGAPAFSDDEGPDLAEYNKLCKEVLLPKLQTYDTLDEDSLRAISIEFEIALLHGRRNSNLGEAIKSHLMSKGPENQWISSKMIQHITCATLLEAICAKQVLGTACANTQFYRP